MRRKVLIVEDHDLNRKLLQRILSQDYEVLEASNGIEALQLLDRERSALSAVILDIFMPMMDGFAVLRRMQQEPDLAQIPVIVATGTDDHETEGKALKAGAIDYITKPYNADILRNRLRNTINLREQAAIVNATRRDALTGLMSRAAFFEHVKEKIQEQNAGYYVMACFDIDRFKIINDQYGSKKGDEVLKQIAKVFKEGFGERGAMIARIMADNFAVLYPKDFMNTEEIAEIRRKASILDGTISPVTFSIGRYIVEDLSIEPSAMYDRAVIAKESVKGRYDEHIAMYDEVMRNRILSEQEIISEMRSALTEDQFEVWYQPQFNHVTSALIGAEALVRWRHPIKGLISPGLFIPIFERNGFVYEVDKYVWEQTCKFLKEIQKKRKQIVPISVNISRYDIYREDLVDYLSGLIKKYKLPADALRLEITESAFVSSNERLVQVVDEFKKLGFTIEIDDFGSGYSSLNTLKDVPADVLKLDMRFLEGKSNSEKGGSILQSIVRMSRWIGMSVIAEGVETIEQADFLKSVGCYYIQGYLYSRPLPKAEYEKVVYNEQIAERMATIETVETYDSDAFWNPESMETLIFNSFIGGACIFEYQEGNVEIIRVNDKYTRVLCGDSILHRDPLHLDWDKYIAPGYKKRAIKAMQDAIATGNEVQDELELLDFRNEGESVYLRAIMRVIASAGNRYMFYCVLEDITEKINTEKKERLLTTQLETILKNMYGGVSVCSYHEDILSELFYANECFFAQRGYTKEQYIQEVRQVIDRVCPEDLPMLRQKGKQARRNHKPFEAIYRVIRRNGSIMWVRSKIAIIHLDNYKNPIQIAITDDITKEKESAAKEKETDMLLKMILANVGSGITATIINDKNVQYLYANDQYYDLVGFTRDEFDTMIQDPYHTIHREDRNRIRRAVNNISVSDGPVTLEYRVVGRDECIKYVRMVAVNARLENDERIIQLSVYSDITQEVAEEEKRKELIENLPCGAGIFDITGGTIKAVYLNNKYWELVGRKPDPDSETTVLDAIQFEDRSYLTMFIQKIIISGKEQECEIHVLNGDGSYSPFLLRANIMRQISGKRMLYVIYTKIESDALSYRRMLPVALETMMASSTDLSFVKDRTFTYVCASHAFARMAGLLDEREVIGKTDYDLFDSELADKFRADDKKLIKNGKALVDYIENLPSHDGKLHYSRTSKYILRDANGIVMGLYGVGRDITEEIISSNKLSLLEKESQNRFEHEMQLRKTLIQDSVLYYQVNLTTGVIEEFESKYRNISKMKKGVRVDEYIRNAVVSRILPQDVDKVRNVMFYDALTEAYKRGEKTLSVVYRRLLNDDRYHWVKMNAFLMEKPDNCDAAAFLYCMDVDREWKTQLSIETILDDNIEFVIYVDVRYGRANIAHMIERINYYHIQEEFDFQEAYDRYRDEVVVEEDRQIFGEFFRLEEFVERLTIEKTITLTYRVHETDGIHRKQTRAYYLDELQDIVVLTSTDITNLYLEEQKQKNDLRMAVARANEASHAKSEFLSRMSHDIRTPLNAVLAFSNKELLDGANEKKLKEYLNKINVSGEYLLGIINDVLDMSRIEQNRIELNPQPYALKDFVGTIHNVIDELSKKRRIEFVMDTKEAGEQTILVDRVRFNQIFINLLSNSVKFTKKGGKVEFIVREIEITKDQKRVKQFIVRDNGIGMSKDFVPHAFESFNQEYRKESSERNQGTGLGLAIVKELVRLMNGTINLESEVNVGTTFTITIPVTLAESALNSDAKSQYDYEKLRGVRILLAEDNDINTEIARALLEKQGCIVERAENGEIACRMVKASPMNYYQLILMDIRMPVMDGLSASEKIRALRREDTKHIPIIAMTADAFNEDERTAYDAGMNAHIAKPIDPHRLYDICCSFLDSEHIQ